jgi:DNA-binding NtrC family response regulator
MEDRILLVDDEEYILHALQRALADEPYRIHAARGAEEALQLMREWRFKVVMSDERMPGMGGSEFLGIVRQQYPETIRILLTGHASVESTMRAVNSGEIYRFFTKPWNDAELLLALRSAVDKHDLEAENRRLLQKVQDQSLELRLMERRFPGITRLERDRQGNFLLDENEELDLDSILAECEAEARGM